MRRHVGWLLFLAPVLWGATFPAAKVGIAITGIYPFMAWTRVVGFLTILVALPVVARSDLRWDRVRGVLWPGMLLGGFIFVAYILQTEGLARTTATNAGFITGLYVVFVPVLGLMLYRQPAGRALWVAVALSVLGLALLSVPSLRELRPQGGDLLVLASALLWAAQVVALGRLAGRHPPLLLSLAQMGGAALLHLVVAAPGGLAPGPAVEAWPLLVVTGILGSGVAYTIQVLAQREMTPGRAVVILAGESVASAVLAFAFLEERLLPHQWAGAVVVLGAMVLSEVAARREVIQAEAAAPT
jgi:drug/metabolite transporter (DMT)-like permease